MHNTIQGTKLVPFRRPRITERLKFWLGFKTKCFFAPGPVSSMIVFHDMLLLAAHDTVFRLDKTNGEFVIVPFHETICNNCKGELK